MLEAILNMFTDSLIPDSVIKWFRRRISYKKRIAESIPISTDYLFTCLSDLPSTINDINSEIEKFNAKVLLLIAYPNVDDSLFWQCLGINEKNKFLFELKFEVSKSSSFNLNEEEMYCVVL